MKTSERENIVAGFIFQLNFCIFPSIMYRFDVALLKQPLCAYLGAT